MTISMWVATVSWLCLIFGFIQRKKPKLHIPFVLSGILIDITLVLFLQISRDALHTAIEFKLSLLNQIHILMSSLALALYCPVLYLGFNLLRGNYRLRDKHRIFALLALAFRTAGFLFMFSMWKET